MRTSVLCLVRNCVVEVASHARNARSGALLPWSTTARIDFYYLVGRSRTPCPTRHSPVATSKQKRSAHITASFGALPDRHTVGKNPTRIILDSHGTIKSSSKILQTCDKIQTIIVTTNLISAANLSRLRKFPIQIITCGNSSVSIPKLLKILHNKGIKKIIVEGGGTINWSFLKHGFVDELIITIAPYILGGSNSKTLVEGDGFKNLLSATKLKLKKIQKINNELVVFYKI